MIIHVVQSGDTLYSIANRYGVTVSQLMRDNEIQVPELLTVGQSLLVLQPRVIHRVRSGDTLYSIALEYGLTVMNLIQNNPPLSLNDHIYPGQELVVVYAGEKWGRAAVNGYAYPYINRRTLLETLPYLSFLSVFSYGIYPDGRLVPIDDDELVRMARSMGTAPILVLTPSDENGQFSNQLASEMLNDPQAQERLINNLLAVVREKGYYGVDVDFEYILPQDRQVFVDFVARTRVRLDAEGYAVFVALAPKVTANQPGLLYESHDYQALGAAADLTLLMTYEWGYTYGPPMAVAPINKVREVLNYAVTEIPREKISMGIPNYGYDWMLPFIKGESKARTVGNVEAVRLAMELHAPIQFDELAQTPFFNYRDETGREHVVWFEDARSIKAKLELVASYRFQGMGYWNVMRMFRQNWMLVNNVFDIVKF